MGVMRVIIALFILLSVHEPVLAGTPRQSTSAKLPVVVVSIKPIHSLVCAVMEGMGQPLLLMQTPGQSPHTFSLKPSDILMAKSADLFVWVGTAYETCLKSVVERLPQASLMLMEIPELTLYPPRRGGLWGNGHEHGHHHEAVEHYDGHIWLDPSNAKIIATTIAERLSTLDPHHEAQYKANAVILCQRLDQLKDALTAQLKVIRKKPYIVTHDAYLYWDHAFGTQACGAVLPDPEHAHHPAHLFQLQSAIKKWQTEGQKVYLFAEPQLPTTLLRKLGKLTKTTPITIDPIGDAYELGKEAYFSMMTHLANTLVKALG